MSRTCKHTEENNTTHKCNDYYVSQSKGGVVMCRVIEWKRKKGVCPYDKTIFSVPKKILKAIKDKEQRTL